MQDVECSGNKLAHLIPEIWQIQNDRMSEEKYEEEKKVEVSVSPGSAALHADGRHAIG